MGSIAGGGRYDNLVGAFASAAAGEGKKTTGVSCVGVSMGLDRIFAIVWPKWVEKGMRSKGTMAYVMAAGDGLLEERIQLVQELREAGIKVSIHQRVILSKALISVLSRISWRKISQKYQLSSQLRNGKKLHLLSSLVATS